MTDEKCADDHVASIAKTIHSWPAYGLLMRRALSDAAKTGSSRGASPFATSCGAPRIADDFLSGIEDDCYAARSAAAGSSDWAFLASIPAISVKGFDIDVRVDESGISASFGGLNHDFPEISLALVWVRRALSRQYQLRIVCIGGLAREWYLEPVGRDQQTHQANGLDSSESLAAGHPVLMRRWRKTSVNYRRNHLLDLAGPGIVGH